MKEKQQLNKANINKQKYTRGKNNRWHKALKEKQLQHLYFTNEQPTPSAHTETEQTQLGPTPGTLHTPSHPLQQTR